MTVPVSPSEKVLARILDTCQPGTLLYCGDIACHVSRLWKSQRESVHLLALDPLDPNARLPLDSVPDLAIITNTLEHLSYEEGALLLGQLRNYGTHQIAVLVSQTPNWGFTDFIALGFQRHANIESENGALTLFTYNLDTYNHKRAWNNPENWANPEMWGKAWW